MQLGNLTWWKTYMNLVATWISSACVHRESCANTARGCSEHGKPYCSVNQHSLSQFIPTMLRLLTPEIALPVLLKAASLAWHWVWSSETVWCAYLELFRTSRCLCQRKHRTFHILKFSLHVNMDITCKYSSQHSPCTQPLMPQPLLTSAVRVLLIKHY